MVVRVCRRRESDTSHLEHDQSLTPDIRPLCPVPGSRVRVQAVVAVVAVVAEDVEPAASVPFGNSAREALDVSPLGTLTSLTHLFVDLNPIVDVSPLSTLTELLILDLFCPTIVDVSSLATLTSLQRLILDTVVGTRLLVCRAWWQDALLNMMRRISMTRISRGGCAAWS